MNKLNNLGLKKLKIHFEYNAQRITVIAEPYKTIKEMKAKAVKQIFPLPTFPRLFYLNREISFYENEQVGTYFAGKSAIIIKITSGEYLDEIGQIPITSKNQINNESNDINISSSTVQSRRAEVNMMNSREYSCVCRNEYVMYYCRNCREFLCRNCRSNKKHKTHLTIQVDTKNLEESIRLYAMIVQTDIETNIQSSQDFYTRFKNNSHLETASRQEEIFNKLEELTRRYDEIMSIIDNSTSTSNEIPLVISEFNLNSKIINGEIDNILNEVYVYSKNKKKMTYDQFKSYLNLINSKEKDWDGMTKDVMKYKINLEINNKVNRMYEKINGAIDELLNDRNSFLLEEKSLSALNDLRLGNDDINIKETNIKHMNTNTNSNNPNQNSNYLFGNKMIQPNYDVNDDSSYRDANTNTNTNANPNVNAIANHYNTNDHDTDEEDRRKREAKVLREKTKMEMKKKKDIEEKEIKVIKGIHDSNDNNDRDRDREKKNNSEQLTQTDTTKKEEKEPVVFDEYKSSPKKRRK